MGKIEKQISRDHRFYNFIKAIYLLPVGIFIFTTIHYLNQNRSLKVFWNNMVVYKDGKTYELKEEGTYVIVWKDKVKNETAVLESGGDFVDSTFYFFTNKKELLKITPYFIMPAKPNFVYYMFKQGINNEKRLGIDNPPHVTFSVLALILAIVVHRIIKSIWPLKISSI